MVTHVVLAERDDTHSCSHSSQAGVRVGKGLSGTWAVTCVPKGAFCVLSGIRHRQRGLLSTGKILYGHGIGFGAAPAAVLLQLLGTVGAAKLRPFRDATANMWAEGKPSGRQHPAMAAGPDESLWVFGGESGGTSVGGIPGNPLKTNDLFKLDLDTKEWHIIEPRGSVKPSARILHRMVSVGIDLYVFGGRIRVGMYSNELFRFSTTVS